jgi:protease YdgD
VPNSSAPKRAFWLTVALAFGVAFATLAAIAQTATAQSADLKRLTLRNDILGWEGVGRLDLGDRGFCTGVLVASDIVMTAAHCLFDPQSKERIAPETITFRAGVRDGVAVAERRGRRAVAHPGFNPLSGMGENRVQFDVGLLQLSAPISTTDADPFAVDVLDSRNSEVSVVSYGVGRAETPSRQGKCQVTGRTAGMIGFDCNVTFGSSGAPIFQRRNGKLRVVSLISAGARQADQRITVGMELPDLFTDLRGALRSGQGVWPQTGVVRTRRLSVSEGAPTDSGARFLKP